MFAEFSTDRRSRKLPRRSKSYRPIAEKLEARRLLAVGLNDYDFSFVDNDNDRIFDATIDVVVNTEVMDGRFDTRVAEGNYVPDPVTYPDAGLYIGSADPPAGTPRVISVPGDMTYRANGDLTVNTNLTAGDDVELVSRNGSVLLDDPTITAPDDIEIRAALDIVSTDDVIEATGPGSEVELTAGRDIALFGTSVTAVREVELTAGRDIALIGTSVTAEREVDLEAGGVIDADGSLTASHPTRGEVELEAGLNDMALMVPAINVSNAVINAGKEIELEAIGDIVADTATLQAGEEIELESGMNIDVSGATIDAGEEIELEATGDIIAVDANINAGEEIELEAGGNINLTSTDPIVPTQLNAGEEIELEAGLDINASGATIDAGDEIELESEGGAIIADNAMIGASMILTPREIELKAAVDINVDNARLIASRDIELRAGGIISAVDAVMEALGSRKADIELKATLDINVNGATLSASDEVELDSKGGSIDASPSVAVDPTTATVVTAGDDIELEALMDINVTGWTAVAPDIELDAGGTITPAP